MIKQPIKGIEIMKHTITYKKTDKQLNKGQSQTIKIVDDNYTTKKILIQYSKQGQLTIHIKDIGKDKEWEILKNVMSTKLDNPSYIPVITMDNEKLEVK